ncbi:MAG: thiamine pyrophosphate-dependent enzyme [Nocardioides sp.]
MIAEPSSGGAWPASVRHGSLLLDCPAWLDRHRPRRVLVVGRVTLSRAVAALLRHPDTLVDLVTGPGPAGRPWPDPGAVVRRVYPWESLRAPDPSGAPGDPATADLRWRQTWQDAGFRASEAIGPVLDAAWPSGPALARAVVAAIPSNAVLLAGASAPVRDVDLVGPPTRSSTGSSPGRSNPQPGHLPSRIGPQVLANRGLAGIDGTLSTAIGLALADPAPTYALVGDLTALHDLTALAIGPYERRPDLTVVIANDGGGGIFTVLEPGDPEHASTFERVFGTPTGVKLEHLARGFGVQHHRIRNPAELAEQCATPPQGLTILEVPFDRAARRPLQARLRDIVTDALADAG